MAARIGEVWCRNVRYRCVTVSCCSDQYRDGIVKKCSVSSGLGSVVPYSVVPSGGYVAWGSV